MPNMAASEINVAIRAYSTAVAPPVFRQRFRIGIVLAYYFNGEFIRRTLTIPK